uniref:FXYD domain-containing ion transport regulator n=1 Tax=Oncorhynchus kisutch TaxID=8019 RepID=A0A8C7C252_ONCKI
LAHQELMFHDQSDFEYDYETLRTTGVIIGVILFVSGILIALTLIQQAPKYQRQRVSRHGRGVGRERERKITHSVLYLVLQCLLKQYR